MRYFSSYLTILIFMAHNTFIIVIRNKIAVHLFSPSFRVTIGCYDVTRSRDEEEIKSDMKIKSRSVFLSLFHPKSVVSR